MDIAKHKLDCVPKTKIINVIDIEEVEKKLLNKKTKNEIIDYCLQHGLLTQEKTDELYNLYKNSINSVLYLLESNINGFDYNKLSEKVISETIKKINTDLKDKPIRNFKLESLENIDEYVKISFTYTKEIKIIYGGNPIIKGYSVGDILTIDKLEDAIVLHYKKFKRFIIKSNDVSAMRHIKRIIGKIFLITLYHPQFDKNMIEKMTMNPNGKNHIIRASFNNVNKDKRNPGVVSVSDDNLEGIDMFSEFEGNENYSKVYNCFKVDICGIERFVAISNTKGKLWIPAFLDKLELDDYVKAILDKIEHSLYEIRKNPLEYVNFYSAYEFHTNPNKNKILRNLTRQIVANDCNLNILNQDEFYYELIKYCKAEFLIILNDYYCETHEYIQCTKCPNCGGEELVLKVDNSNTRKEILVMCKSCKYKSELLKFYNEQKTFCCKEEFQAESYSDIITVIPKDKTLEIIKLFFSNINYPSYLFNSFYICNGKLKINKLEKQEQIVKLDFFKPFSKILSMAGEEKLYSELKEIHERCLVFNPKKEFCKECSNDNVGMNLDGVEIFNNKFHNNKIRICLPRLFGYCINLSFDGIHNGFEKADVKFCYDENKLHVYDLELENEKKYLKVGIHVKAGMQDKAGKSREPRNCNNPKITSAIGHIVTSAYKKDFDIIGFAMPNKFNENIIQELSYLSKALGIKLLIIDRDDWLKIYTYYNEQKQF